MEKSSIDPLEEAEHALMVSTLVTSILAVLKGVVGYYSGSVALVTDAFHSGADGVTRFASWFGLKISQRGPDERFPYGYYKAETVVALFVSVLILYAGYEAFTESITKLFEISDLQAPLLALAVSLTSAVAAFLLSRHMKKMGEKTKSQSLMVSGEDTSLDVYASLLVVGAIISTHFQVPYVEGVSGVALSLLVFKVGLENGKDALFNLMDVSPSKEIENKVAHILESCKEAEEFEGLRLRRSGPFIFGEVTLRVKKFLDIQRAHEVAEKVEKRIDREVEQIESFMIHIEPYMPQTMKIVMPTREDKGLKSKITDHFGRSKYLTFFILKGGEVESRYTMENPYLNKKVRAGLRLSHELVEEKVYALVTRQIGEISFHTLGDHLVDIYITKADNAEEAVQEFIQGKTKHLEKPTRDMGTEQMRRTGNS
ncbi:MAG: cation diffusion facilitator family transporter [Thermoproteota archaeon]